MKQTKSGILNVGLSSKSSMDKTFENEMRSMMADLKELTKLGTIRSKALYSVEDVAFLTGFSTLTVYGWIHNGRSFNSGKKTVFLKPADGLAERGFRIFPDELDHFLSHFPPAKAI
ncbi:helix-turn-helix domain-containing protein [Larkinella humicola]|uniref:Helix-turn-helix domain-containing protein n=1 Tax=Larkinella humicola TaxID=2607654 RepID=A0A5N1JBK2_9BACT|nr:helix-turn-helix domain-containing protein [Larkinella humicola]KAA9349738.1 helix-turn-helix domain-containing protein [Larkinella humicola]